MNVGIRAIDFAVGNRIIKNQFFETYLDTTDEWIRNKIGVVERRYVEESQAFTDLAYEASRKVVEKSNIDVLSIDLIIASTITPDHQNVASACLLQELLGAKNAAAFDISCGSCPGSIYSLATGAKFVSSGQYKNVLIVSGEIFSKFINMDDRSICVYFGDGVGAVILSEVDAPYGFIAEDLGADGSGYYALEAEAGGSRLPITEQLIREKRHFAKMDGKAIWDFATAIFPESINQTLIRANMTIDHIDFVISHQANINIIKEGMKSLGLDMSKTYTNIDKYGNTGGASVYIALAEAFEKGLIKKGDIIVLVAFGGGLAYGSLLMRWAI